MMEEFQQMSITVHDRKQKRQAKQSRILSENEVALLMRTSRETVEQLMERSVKIGQSECKRVRDLIGALSNLSAAFHPPSDLILEEVSLLVDTLMIALASTKVPVESLILFGTAFVQILVIGPCILNGTACQKCVGFKGGEKALAVHSIMREKYNVEMDSLPSSDSTSLLAKIIASDWPVPTARSDSFQLTLCYAYVMSSTRLHNLGAQIQLELLVSSEVYDVIFRECSKYSKLTTLAFKTLASWLEKVSEFGLSLSSQVTHQAFTITSSSWKVSLSGVRKDNAAAFSTLLSSRLQTPFLPSLADLLQAAIKQQLWTDVTKYYTITELVGLITAPKVLEKYANEIVEGLTTSFSNNQLAAAGAHLYELLLRQLTLFYWNKYFLHPILRLIEDIDGPSARRLRKLQTDRLALSATTEKIRTIQLNILNYWLRITANIFPDALITLRRETFEKLRSTDFESHDHLSFLSAGVLFLSRKKGLWDPLSDSEFRKMSTYRNEVTSETYFKTVCVSCKISDKIGQQEFEMILEYVRHHINVDSTRMRQEMIRSMKAFFHRFHVSNVHHQKLPTTEDAMNSARRFLKQLLNFLSENLMEDIPSGKRISYQRRIASLQIYLELLRSVNETKNSKLPIGESPSAQRIKVWHSEPQQQTILANCIEDQTDNIQNTAFSILRESIDKTAYEMHSWLDTGIQKCHNPKSHVAQSGKLYILLASQSLYSQFKKPDLVDSKLEQVYPSYKKIYSSSSAEMTPVTLLVFNIGLQVWKEFQSKPMELTKIKSLHGIIDTMAALVLKSDGPEFKKLQPPFQQKLLQFVEDVSNFCVNMFMSSTENKDCAPSFAEMGEAIKIAARQVDDDDDDEMDDSAVNTSSDERLLVKHLWLNLKACCNFAANVDGSAEMTQKSLHILIHVLRRCRHKGAIEAAGESLQHLIGIISKVPKSGDEGAATAEKRSLPLSVLKDFLEDLVSGKTAHKTSTTRRSAGLAIFVHHIVIGDADPEKPLLKVALSELIAALKAPISETNVSERDLPQAQTLHILRTLVADASLRVTLTPYINVVAQSALVYLTSTLWSVRNGALQLFGALVPILVGQESLLSDFYFFHKNLFGTLLNFVESATVSECLLQSHSDAVPTLVLLSRLTAPPNLFSSQELIQNVQRLKSVYFKLLASQIMSVRSLAARGLSRINSIDKPSQMVHAIRKWLEENKSQNAFHGALLAVQFIWDRCQPKEASDLHEDSAKLIEFLTPLLRSRLSSDLLLKMSTDILNKKNDPGNKINQTIEYLKTATGRLDKDHAKNELQHVVHHALQNPSLSSGALESVLFFLQNNPQSSNDIVIEALTAAQQLITIIAQNQDNQIEFQIDQLYQLLKKWNNQSVRSAAFVVLFGLANLTNFKSPEMVKTFIAELKVCCSFAGNREPNNQLKMATALRFLASYPDFARDFQNSLMCFLQSDSWDIRNEAAEIIAQGRFGHTECLLRLLNPGLIRVYCRTDFMVALSLCDRLLFSDDELLVVLGEVCGGCNVDVWRRDSPYLEDWFVADVAYRQMDTFLDGGVFQREELEDFVAALGLNEIRPFLKQCEELNLVLGSSDVESHIKCSPFIKNHRKWIYRVQLQQKCQRLLHK